jgi:hypothetical protein
MSKTIAEEKGTTGYTQYYHTFPVLSEWWSKPDAELYRAVGNISRWYRSMTSHQAGLLQCRPIAMDEKRSLVRVIATNDGSAARLLRWSSLASNPNPTFCRHLGIICLTKEQTNGRRTYGRV